MEHNVDLGHYYAIHDKMRVDLERFRVALAVTLPQDSRRVNALSRWATGFVHELHAHHVIEDDIVFPDLAARVPEIQSLLDELGSDHVRVSGLLAELGPAAERLADRRRSFDEARTTLAGLADELSDLLQRHLDIEDDEVLPAFAEHYTKTEYEALTQRVMKSVPKKGLFFSIPWNVAAQPAAQRQEMLAEAPAILRLIFRLANPRYQRLVAAAFGGIPEPPVKAATTGRQAIPV